jgi:hypothetical protein
MPDFLSPRTRQAWQDTGQQWRDLLGDRPSVAEQMGALDQAQRAALKRGGVRDLLGDPEVQARAADVASNLDFTGTFGGVKAKTAPTHTLQQAENMAHTGADPADIWGKTGWFQGPDKQWRFEINDKASMVNTRELDNATMLGSNPARAKDVFSHHSLYAAYPELAETAISGNVPAGAGGVSRGGSIGIKHGLSERDQRKLMLHELQHEIQNKEGFAKGGSPEEFRTATWEDQDRRAKLFQNAALTRDRMESFGESLIEASEAIAKRARQDPEELRRLVVAYPGGDLDEAFYEALARAQKFDPSRRYRALAGETESRTVEARRDLLSSERKARPPWLDYDVPPEQQVIR